VKYNRLPPFINSSKEKKDFHSFLGKCSLKMCTVAYRYSTVESAINTKKSNTFSTGMLLTGTVVSAINA
jgi:hypothetical protein